MVVPIVLLAAVAALVVWSANRSAFHPSRYPEGNWDALARLGAIELTFPSLDGTRLSAWWLAPGSPSAATLFLHGNAGNAAHRVSTMIEIAAAGSAVLMLDYRGYGKSEGRPTEAGLYQDARAAFDILRAKAAAPAVLHGESLGTAAAVKLAGEVDCAGLILEAPFPSARAVAQRVLPGLGPLLVWGFNTEANIGKVRCPVLIIHGGRDEVIDIELGRRVYEAAPDPKDFWLVPGAGHNDLAATAGPAYRDRLRTFYQSLHR